MFSDAGLFAPGGVYGLPEDERFVSGIGSRKEHVTRRCTSGGLGRGLSSEMEGIPETETLDMSV
jgi:hypothetical protein